jgi:hypothetical protein
LRRLARIHSSPAGSDGSASNARSLFCTATPFRSGAPASTVEFRAGRVSWLYPFQVIWRPITQGAEP